MIGGLPTAVRNVIRSLLRFTSVADMPARNTASAAIAAADVELQAATRLSAELKRLEHTIVLRPFEVSKDNLKEGG